MSRDPFEELFGPLSDDAGNTRDGFNGSDTPTAPLPTPEPVVEAATTPMPARQRLAHEQAERVHTSQSTTPRAGRSGGGSKNARALPWIIVGAVAIIAIIVSIVVVNAVRGADTPPEAAPDTNTSETVPQQPETEPGTDSPATPPSEEPKPEEKPSTEAPDVEVGDTVPMVIGPWGATSDLSLRFGSTSFYIPDGVNLELSSDLLGSFPAGCADMRTAWGATKLEDGSFQVRKPAETCAEAPELYDTVWGLVSAWVDTIKTQ